MTSFSTWLHWDLGVKVGDFLEQSVRSAGSAPVASGGRRVAVGRRRKGAGGAAAGRGGSPARGERRRRRWAVRLSRRQHADVDRAASGLGLRGLPGPRGLPDPPAAGRAERVGLPPPRPRLRVRGRGGGDRGGRTPSAAVPVRAAQPAVPLAGVQEARGVRAAGRLHRAVRRQEGHPAQRGRHRARRRRVLRRGRPRRGRGRGRGRRRAAAAASAAALRGLRLAGARAVRVRLRQPHVLVAVPPGPAQLRAPRGARAPGVPRLLPVQGAAEAEAEARAQAQAEGARVRQRRAAAAPRLRAGRDGQPPAGLVLRAHGAGARRAAAARRLPGRLQAGGALDVRAPGRGRRRAAVVLRPVPAEARRARALPAAVPVVVRLGRARRVPRRVVRLPAARGAALHGAGPRAPGRPLGLVRAVVRLPRLLPRAPVPRRAGRVLVRGRARRGGARLAHQGRPALPAAGAPAARGARRRRGRRRRVQRRRPRRRRRARLLAAAPADRERPSGQPDLTGQGASSRRRFLS